MRSDRLLILLALALAGCRTQRSIEITSQPPGARVRLDEQEVGITPVTVPFEFYGTRRITFYKAGYRTRSEQIRLRPPWYFRFPLDVVTEVFLPFGWRDRRAYHMDLVQGQEVMSIPSLRSVIDRANVLRQSGPEGPRHLPETRPQEVLPADETPAPPAKEETEEPPERPAPEDRTV